MAKIEGSIDYVLENEGGFTNIPQDHGGATNFGITIGDLASWRHHAVSVDDVRHMTKSEAMDIYKVRYWDVLHLDRVQSQAMATCLFDTGVIRGVGIARQYLNQIMGQLGKTDVNLCDPKEFITHFEKRLEQGYNAIVMSHPDQRIFYRGWMNRAHKLLTLIA